MSPNDAAAVLRKSRQERIARNEVRFREVNERMQAVTPASDDADDAQLFVCECGRESCTELIRLRREDYEDLRRDSRRFAVTPGHVFYEAERVVATTDGYQVVEKLDAAGELADATDRRPR